MTTESRLPAFDPSERASIEPTYDHRETGDRFSVETRINGRRLDVKPMPDPFMNHLVHIGWRDVLRFILRGREVEVLVSGDAGIVEDVCELNADYLGLQRSSRRREWNDQVEQSLKNMVSEGGNG